MKLVSQPGIRWAINRHGVERIEVIARARNHYDQYRRMTLHFGKRLVLYGRESYRPISGWIVDVQPIGEKQVRYVAKGAGWRLDDEYGPTVTSYTETTTTGAMLENFLTDDVRILDGDMSEVDDPGTALGGWSHTAKQGTRAGDFVKFAINASDSSGNIWDFYMQDNPFSGTAVNFFKPFFKNRALRTTPDWIVKRKDLTSLTMNLSIYDARSRNIVFYGLHQSTCTAGGSATVLNDTGASFLDGSFTVGDTITNITDESTGRIRDIVSGTQINSSTLSGGTLNTFTTGHKYSIERKAVWNLQSAQRAISLSSSFPILRTISEHHTDMSSTQATQRALAMREQFSYPVQAASFSIGAAKIRDSAGGLHPLWRVIENGGGVIEISDLFPNTGTGTDSLTRFFITALDYDGTSKQLRVAVDVPDRRLDVALADAGIIRGETVQRGKPPFRGVLGGFTPRSAG
ncbi:MAG: hypothetical protein GY938_12725 [Ketobacter sp.]|nr:hypothetical protein [Ketobacter sp.]